MFGRRLPIMDIHLYCLLMGSLASLLTASFLLFGDAVLLSQLAQHAPCTQSFAIMAMHSSP